MRIMVRGWGRDQGEKEIMNAALSDAIPGPDDRYSRGETYLNVENPNVPWAAKVRVSTSADLRLGGTYLLHVELKKSEIAQLFYKTHSNEIVRMVRSFIEDEARQDAARRLAQFEERQRREQTVNDKSAEGKSP